MGDDPGLAREGPKCNHKGLYVREAEGDLRHTAGEKAYDPSRGRDGQGMLAVARRWRRQGTDSPLEPAEGAWPCRPLDFGLQDFRTTRGFISIVLSCSACGSFLWQQKDTKLDSFLNPGSSTFPREPRMRLERVAASQVCVCVSTSKPQGARLTDRQARGHLHTPALPL